MDVYHTEKNRVRVCIGQFTNYKIKRKIKRVSNTNAR